MAMSFRTVRNLGLSALLLIIVLVSVFSYWMLKKNADELTYILGIVLISCVIFTIIIAFVMNRAFYRPIKKLVNAINCIAKGDLTQEVEVESDDEIGKLLRGFNNMVKDLRESRKLLVEKNYVDSIIDNMIDCLIITAPDLTIKTVNKATLDLLGYSKEEITGKLLFFFVETKKVVSCIVDLEIRRENEFRNFEVDFKRKDGKKVPVLFSIAFVKGENGKVEYFVCMAKDITEQKKAEEELKEYIKKIEDINSELDTYTYIVSHDLKEPLRAISAFSEFIKSDYEDKLDEAGRNYVCRIKANSIRIQSIIEDFLEVSSIERRINSFDDVEAEELVNGAKLRLEKKINDKNAEIVINDKLPVIFCNRRGLIDVFTNLISNAIKFADKSQLRIEIGCREKEDFYEFYVKDNGPGIEEQYFEKIFKLFQRLVKREDYNGTGVGLTIAKKIVRVHKGKIWLESKMGEGTTFSFTIPKSKEIILHKEKFGINLKL